MSRWILGDFLTVLPFFSNLRHTTYLRTVGDGECMRMNIYEGAYAYANVDVCVRLGLCWDELAVEPWLG